MSMPVSVPMVMAVGRNWRVEFFKVYMLVVMMLDDVSIEQNFSKCEITLEIESSSSLIGDKPSSMVGAEP